MFITRLKELIKERKINQKTLLEQLGINKNAIRIWEQKESLPNKSTLIAIADYFNVTVDYLLGKSEKRGARYDNIYPIVKKRIPVLGEIACGKPMYAIEDRESYMCAGTDIQADFCLKCKGDSMIGARINDGDYVFIKEQPMVNNGEIAAVIVNDEATLKRVMYYPEKNMIILKAENPRYADIVLIGAELDNVHILGKAIAFQSDVT